MDGKGYIIPDNPIPEGHYCLKVYIPADEYYLYAFSGAYQFFAKWLAWERDSEHRGALAAEAWRVAIQRTFAEGWLNCGEDMCNCEDVINDITGRLEELENMNISVNCGCGCGCGCGNNQTITPDPPETLPPIVIAPTPTPEDDLGLLWKCNMAHYMAYMWRLWGMYCNDFYVTNAVESIENIWLNLGLDPPSYANRFAWCSIAATLMSPGPGAGEFASVYDEHYDQIVCALYTAPTAAAAADNLQTMISLGSFGEWGSGLWYLIYGLPFEALMTPQETFDNLPVSFRNRDCSNCAGSSTPPEEGNWYFVNRTLSGTLPTVDNLPSNNVEFYGTAHTESASTLSASARFAGYEETEQLDTIAAVAFTMETISMSGTFTPNSQNGISFGGESENTNLLGVVSDFETVLVQRAGYEQSDAGDFDHVFTVNTNGKLIPMFNVNRFYYHPTDETFDIQTADFEIRLIA